MSKAAIGVALAATMALSFGVQAQTAKIAYIDPLSGGMANVGDLGVKHFQYFVDKINAAGGVAGGKKLEFVPYDNKLSPQESLILLKKAIDEGIQYIAQGNGSLVAHALTDQIQKHNERNPGKEVMFLNYAAVDPALTNEKCHFFHFRFDADADMKMQALTNVMVAKPSVKKVYLINQDYSFGKAVAAAARDMLTKKSKSIQLVGDELHPLARVTDFSPYVAKIKAAGTDSVVTGNWGNDMSLLIKASRDAGLEVDWYTYYAGALGSPAAIGAAGKDRLKQVTEWHRNADAPVMEATMVEYEKHYNADRNAAVYHEFSFARVKNLMDMLVVAMNEAKSTDAKAVAMKIGRAHV